MTGGFALTEQGVAGLVAEMGKVDHRRGIVRQHQQLGPDGKRSEDLARLEDRQGAKKTKGVEHVRIGHEPGLRAPIAAVHSPTAPGHANVRRGAVTRLAQAAKAVKKGVPMFGFDIIDAALLPAMAIALAAGVISFLSPCVLPIVPPYLAYMGGVSMSEMNERRAGRRVVLTALFFVLGLSTVFIFLGFTASAFGMFFLKNQSFFNTFAGLVVMVFGLHFLGILRMPFLERDLRMDAGDRGGSAFGAYVLGLAFAFGWTPCIGPQLGAILSLAASEGSVARGTLLLAVYAAGLGLPFLLVAAFFPHLTGTMAWMKRHMGRIERLMGLLLWTIGLLMLTGGFSQFSWWLLETFPGLAQIG